MANTPETLRAQAKHARGQATQADMDVRKYAKRARELATQANRLERIPKFLRPLLGRFVR